MEITEEQRAAVLAQMCAEQGHLLDIDEAISDDPDISDEMPTINVRARDKDSLPHLRCRRCGWVWLVPLPGGPSYEAAEQAMNELLQPKHRRKLRRERRRERLAAEAAEAKRIADEAAATSLQPGQPLAPVDGTSAPTPAPTSAP